MNSIKSVSAKYAHARSTNALIITYKHHNSVSYSSYRNQFISKLVCEAPHQYMEKTTSIKFCFVYVEAQEYRPYDYINSAYREHFPGQKPQMREKIVPRVKN